MQVRKVKLERSGNWDKNKKEVCWRQDKEKRKYAGGRTKKIGRSLRVRTKTVEGVRRFGRVKRRSL